MKIAIELDPDVESRLAERAKSLGMTIEDYAGKLLEQKVASSAVGSGVLTPAIVEKMTEELTRGAESRPVLPPEVNNRESYYEDR